jgi:cystathionine gamma-synthase
VTVEHGDGAGPSEEGAGASGSGRWRSETLAVHLGLVGDDTGAIAPPIHLSTTFEREPDGSYPRGWSYTRSGNPNRDALERALALLHGAVEAACFASGSAAAAAVFRALPAGAAAIVPADMYHGLRVLLEEVLAPAGLRVTTVDMRDPEGVAAALSGSTRLVWVETPSNPMLHITDMDAVTGAVRAFEARTGTSVLVVADATWTPPGWADPFVHDVDLMVHATTKYLSGHSDVLGGVVVAGRSERAAQAFERVRTLQRSEGAVPSPFDCWLTLRGLRTLPLRLRAQAHNAATVAAFLVGHDRVSAVHYPGLPEHPGHEVAVRQMHDPGGMLSFQTVGGEAGAMAVAAAVRLIRRATSLGGVETLIEHRASIEPPGTRTPRDLLRLSLGIEHPLDLVEDLAQALGAIEALG